MSADETTTTPEAPAIEAWSCAECGAEETGSEPQRSNRHGEPLCETCETCDDCAEDLSSVRDSAGENCDGCRVCERCAEDYIYSNAQDATLRREDAVWIADEGEYVSLDYAERNYHWHDADGVWRSYEEEESADLYDYTANVLEYVEYDRAAIRKGALVLGVELEMEPSDDDAEGPGELLDALGGKLHPTHILKYDGSVPTGVELVTAPMTLAEHRGGRMNWHSTLERVRGVARSGAGTDRCGIHIHVNKAAVTPLTVGKMLVFLNCDANDSLVTLIAQRRGNAYCEKKDKRVADGQFESPSRYERLNVTRRTLEFRIFRGNLRAQRVLKNLEFAVAATAYCAESGIRDVERPERFLAWVSDRKRDYPELVAFLREKGALGSTPPKKEKKACA